MKAATVLSSQFEPVLLLGLKGGHHAHEEMVLILSLPLCQRRFSKLQIWAGCEKGPFCVSDSDYLISGEGYWRFLLFWAIALLLLDHPKLWNRTPQAGLIAYEACEPCQKQHVYLCFILYFLLKHGFHVTPRYLGEKLKENMEPEKPTVRGISRTHKWCLYCHSNFQAGGKSWEKEESALL